MKDEVKIYDKLDKIIIKNFTISTITYYFKEWTTILHYQQHKTLLFSTIYVCPHFFYKITVFYITHLLFGMAKLTY